MERLGVGWLLYISSLVMDGSYGDGVSGGVFDGEDFVDAVGYRDGLDDGGNVGHIIARRCDDSRLWMNGRLSVRRNGTDGDSCSVVAVALRFDSIEVCHCLFLWLDWLQANVQVRLCCGD